MDQERPLWQLLIQTAEKGKAVQKLTCADCFALLEYLADENAPHSKENWENWLRKIKKHLQSCPDCKAYYWQKLRDLETYYKQSGKKEIDLDLDV